jgi:hypothetical protein
VLETRHARRALNLYNIATTNFECRFEQGCRRRWQVVRWCTRHQWRSLQIFARRGYKSGVLS